MKIDDNAPVDFIGSLFEVASMTQSRFSNKQKYRRVLQETTRFLGGIIFAFWRAAEIMIARVLLQNHWPVSDPTPLTREPY